MKGKKVILVLFRDSFIEALKKTKNEYDIIAVCYCELLAYKRDNDKNFIARIGCMKGDYEYGIFAEVFEDLRQEVLNIVMQMNMNDEHAGLGFEETKNKIIQKIPINIRISV